MDIPTTVDPGTSSVDEADQADTTGDILGMGDWYRQRQSQGQHQLHRKYCLVSELLQTILLVASFLEEYPKMSTRLRKTH